MAEINRPRPSVEEMSGKIREEIARHRLADRHATDSDSPHGSHERRTAVDEDARHELSGIKLQPDFEADDKSEYHVNDLLKYHDAQFIQNAYRAILLRRPDREGYEGHLESLRCGESNKIDVLARLRYSEEGRAKAVYVAGLRFPATIRRLGRLPLVGYPIRLGIALLRLPHSIRQQQQFEAHTHAQQQQLADYSNHLRALLADYSNQLQTTLADLASRHEALAEEHEALSARFDKEQEALNRRILEVSDELRARISEESADVQRVFQEQLQRTRSEIVLQGQRLQRMFEESSLARARTGSDEQLTRRATEEPQAAALRDQHFLDAFYAALEDRFRGSRSEIKERFRVYLPHVRQSGAVSADAPLVDLGCGRGEWIELLHEEGLTARGVDTNTVLLEECRERGLDVVEQDALAYLGALADESAGAVTGFHIVEHLEVEMLVRLVDEALRVLRPGGILIFETPNPENVLVGSCYFYFDPTHLNPLPNLLMKFLLEARGFGNVEILNLHPWDSARVRGDDELTTRFNNLFYGPMDYAVMARKLD